MGENERISARRVGAGMSERTRLQQLKGSKPDGSTAMDHRSFSRSILQQSLILLKKKFLFIFVSFSPKDFVKSSNVAFWESVLRSALAKARKSILANQGFSGGKGNEQNKI